MTIVIQCAASKRANAGHLTTASGRSVDFVADPQTAPADPLRLYARPDDISDTGISWRQVLLDYNAATHENPLSLSPAYQLYANKAYQRLADRLGVEKVFILSAGWGLIRADFLTPHYDITFSHSADAYKRRQKAESYDDFCMLPDDIADDILFFGGKDYLPLFCSLTNTVKAKRIVFYKSERVPKVNGCVLQRFETTTRTNWHYECANAFLDGTVRIELRPVKRQKWNKEVAL